MNMRLTQLAAALCAAAIASGAAAKEYRSADVHPEDYPTVMAVKAGGEMTRTCSMNSAIPWDKPLIDQGPIAGEKRHELLSRTERRSAAPEDAGHAPEGQHQTHTGRPRSPTDARLLGRECRCRLDGSEADSSHWTHESHEAVAWSKIVRVSPASRGSTRTILCHTTWIWGRRSRSGSARRITSRVTGATSPV